jgi:hypothetical protein
MYNNTGQVLANITDNVMFEYMMCDLLSSFKYKGIEPQSPGMIDNGKDALYYDAVDSIVFAFSIQKGWKGKFAKDFASAKKNNLSFNQFIFGTNQRAFPKERDKIKAEKAMEGIIVDFFDRDRIKVLLDNHYKKIREVYLGIQDNTNLRKKIRNLLFDPDSECEQLLRWQMLQIIAPLDLIGLFNIIKDEDISKIAEEQDEYELLNIFIDKFVKLRKMAGDIDRYIHRALLDMFQSGMPNAYQKSIEYINLRLVGERRDDVEKRIRSSSMYYASDLNFDEKRYEALAVQKKLIMLVESMKAIEQECLEIRERILKLKGFQFSS